MYYLLYQKTITYLFILSISFNKFKSSVIIFSFFKEVHPSNIYFILETLFVLKLDKLRLVKEEHPSNKNPISLTFRVLKLDKSKLVKEEHPENMQPIFFTEEVSKLDKKILVKEEHL